MTSNEMHVIFFYSFIRVCVCVWYISRKYVVKNEDEYDVRNQRIEDIQPSSQVNYATVFFFNLTNQAVERMSTLRRAAAVSSNSVEWKIA